MKYYIDEEVCKSSNVTLPELFAMLLIKTGVNIPVLFNQMVKKELLGTDVFNNYYVTPRWNDICDNIILTSEKTIPKEEELVPLASQLMELFPSGKKPGTNMYWKSNIREVVLRLKKFFKLYGKYSAEDICNATKAYVEYHQNDTGLMRVLKYFILKQDGDKGEISDLATWLENSKEDAESENNWLNTLR